MATITFNCPGCQRSFTTDSSAAGKTARCPACSHRFTVPHPDAEEAAPIVLEADVPRERTKMCRFCGEEIQVAATKCKHCGEWLQRPPGIPTSPQGGIKVVSPANAVIFTIITLAIYQLFWLYRIFKELHARGSTQTTPGKAVGFLFIPFFNFVWTFIVWKEVGDAVAREYANARLPAPATGLVWLAPAANLFGFAANFSLPLGVIQLILLPIVIGNAQSWMNQLANTAVGLSPDRPPHGTPAAAQTRSCAVCGEFISLAASVCRFCGHHFSEQEVAVLQQQYHEQVARTTHELRLRSLASRKTMLQVFGWPLAALGVFFLFGMITMFFSPPAPGGSAEEQRVAAVVAALFVAGPLLCFGVFLLMRAAKINRELSDLAEADFRNNAYADRFPSA